MQWSLWLFVFIRSSACDKSRVQQDIEAESTGFKRQIPALGGAASKRSRAAEVHNLSERKRRDRINQKMRALQELIPNCNKRVDKASMLDEAIEYLKTLQLQVQIMSMGGGGLCMPSIMIPTGMQHMLHAQAPCISPVSWNGNGYGYTRHDGWSSWMSNFSHVFHANTTHPFLNVRVKQFLENSSSQPLWRSHSRIAQLGPKSTPGSFDRATFCDIEHGFKLFRGM